ncbi:bifunctional protein-serine/threonine kinase/phosphatase [Methylobacterium persicinum]|uniref:Serine/threonine protein phosphatase PrpC/predicted Ser/Thr protein kinase n=1 Tax=Methylobacterium persicinum TaxID=374426 RepID=A0ABU0HQV3_9HYPH|nr:bifunctional protein-serine/threonine kinase/phosphatase [Methylobacterium persicinum]MDQ0444714.1 serine/threonine protein phosphatase PrpC/predicted Ser/Thr protein kinase [Methylobacterium persicinum]GJE39728.1 Serine/threonine-protein kinase PknD [Methylobacterium persicinum]
MTRTLTVSIGQHSERGRKDANQDFHGVLVPEGPALRLKGIAAVVADGISSSALGAMASETAVKSFLSDYYATPDSWTVRSAAKRVLAATNSWLYAQTRRAAEPGDSDRGCVTTLSALVLRSRTAHVFHAGDTRISRLAGRSLEQITEDHRVVVSNHENYLGRALGVSPQVEFNCVSVPVQVGDVFVLTSDGVHEHLRPRDIAEAISSAGVDLQSAARRIVDAAYETGSGDNLTALIVRIESLPEGEPDEIVGEVGDLPPAPLLEPPTRFDGYDILRRLHAGSRGHVYLAVDPGSGERVALKVPGIELRGDRDYLRHFTMEEWIARRLDSPHVLKAHGRITPRSHLYTVMRYVEGRTLAQWMADHREPDLETVRRLVEQIARGLQAFHRREMIHGDLRPENVLIDTAGTVQIIDFGATRVAGLVEEGGRTDDALPQGAIQYTAPECFLGDPPSPVSDIFALGVLAYQMLTGRLPYGGDAARARTARRQRRLRYVSARHARPLLPAWVDGALRRATHPDPQRRYEVLSEFVHDLRHPNPALAETRGVPLMERDPILFWRGLCLVLGVTVVVLLAILVLRGH